MGYAPENTFASFERAIELGVDVIEIDVHLTADGEVVIHDAELHRTTDGEGLVGQKTLAELKRLDAASALRARARRASASRPSARCWPGRAANASSTSRSRARPGRTTASRPASSS